MISTNFFSLRATVKDCLTVRQYGELSPDSIIRNFRITAVDVRCCESSYYKCEVVSKRDILVHTSYVFHKEALKKAEVEFGKYQQQLLNEPSPVERHFEEAMKKVKALEREKPKLKEKEKGKKVEGKK